MASSVAWPAIIPPSFSPGYKCQDYPFLPFYYCLPYSHFYGLLCLQILPCLLILFMLPVLLCFTNPDYFPILCTTSRASSGVILLSLNNLIIFFTTPVILSLPSPLTALINASASPVLIFRLQISRVNISASSGPYSRATLPSAESMVF